MARVTKRQINAQKRAANEYMQRYRRVMKEIRLPLLFRLGIMNNMTLGECEDALDLMEEKGIESEIQATASENVMTDRNATDLLIRLAFREDKQGRNFYVDLCNHAYSEAELMIKEMRTHIERFLNDVKSEDVELKARLTVAMLLVEMNILTFKKIRKVNLAQYKVDIYDEMKVFDLSRLKDAWDKLQKMYARIPEMEKDVNITDVEGFRESYDRLLELLTDDEFLNNQCKWAAAMNKEYMPELYENIRKEAEERANEY